MDKKAKNLRAQARKTRTNWLHFFLYACCFVVPCLLGLYKGGIIGTVLGSISGPVGSIAGAAVGCIIEYIVK